MPITLDTPIAGPAAVAAEIVDFQCDLRAGHVRMVFSLLTADGNEIRTESCTSPLFTPQGAPRFSPELYAAIKATLYGIAVEDGHVAGAVV